MFDYQTASLRTLLIVTALSLSASCAETGADDDFNARQNQAAQDYQSPNFEKETPEFNVNFDDPTASIEPTNTVPIHSNQDARKLFRSGVARFEFDKAFQQVSSMMIAQDASKLEYRFRDENGSWSGWNPVQITWKEENFYNTLIRLDHPIHTLEMRGGEYINETEFEFFPVIVARDDIKFVNLNELDENVHHVAEPISAAIDEEIINLNEFNTHPRENGELHAVRQQTLAPDFVISRTSWKARSPNKICGNVVKPYRMAIHHTYAPSSDGPDPAVQMRGMQNYHMDTRKWCDIGYHFIVSQSGKIYQGRSRSDRPGAHVGDNNAGNVGISFIADFTTQTPSTTQLNAGAKIMKWVHEKHGVPLNRTAVKGHREHSGQSTTCPGTSMINRLQQMIDIAKGVPTTPDNQPSSTYKTDVKAQFVALENFYTQGTSNKIADIMVGQTFQTEILVHNQSNAAIGNLTLSYFIESPFISATNYVIQTDHPKHDRKTWTVNDANDAPGNPAKDKLGKSGTLTMHSFGAGETKRVLIDLKADRYSVGLIDHPDVRGWIANIDDLYKQSGWDDAPSLNKIDGSTKSYAQLDILSPDEWQFASTTDKEGLEGWTSRGDSDKLSQNISSAMLAQHVTGKDSGIVSPSWTKIDANAFDQLVFHARSHGGDHHKAIYWTRDGETFSEERVVRFIAKGDGETHPYVIPMGTHPLWTGTVTKLRIDQLDDRAPAKDDTGWYDLASVYFQSSADKITTSEVSAFEPTPPVQLITKNNNNNNNNNNTDTPTPGGVPPGGQDDSKVPTQPGLDDNSDSTDVGINSGCSTVAVTTNNPINTLLILGLGMFALSFIRRRR